MGSNPHFFLGLLADADTRIVCRMSFLIEANAVESAFSLLKRGIMGTWHRISAKHLAAYLEEMSFRFNRRKRSGLFVDTLPHMVTTPVLPFQKLIA